MAGKCLNYADSKLSALNRPCSVSVIIQSQPLTQFPRVFERRLKRADNSREQNTETKTATRSKMPASHSCLIFLILFFFSCHAVTGAAHPDPCRTISSPVLARTKVNLGSRDRGQGGGGVGVGGGLEWHFDDSRARSDQKSRRLSLNITVSFPLMASTDCAIRNKGWSCEIAREK